MHNMVEGKGWGGVTGEMSGGDLVTEWVFESGAVPWNWRAALIV